MCEWGRGVEPVDPARAEFARGGTAASDSGRFTERQLDLDPRVATILRAIDDLRRDIVRGHAGMLGVSATRLRGTVDDNLAALAQAAPSLEALLTIAAGKADNANETWRGLRALLRDVAKQTPQQITAAERAAATIAEFPELVQPWVSGHISAPQVRDIGRLAARVPIEHRQAAATILADHAPGLTVRELQHASRVLLNAVAPGFEERDADVEATKSFFSVYPIDGGYGVSGWLTDEQAGWLRTVLNAHTSVIPSGDTRTFTERQAEALITGCRQSAASDSIPTLAMARPRFVVLATLADLRAIAVDEAPGELPVTTFGDRLDPVTARRLLSEADVVPVLVDSETTQAVVDVALDTATSQRVRATAQLFARRGRSRAM